MINIYPHTSSTTVNHGMCTIHVQSCHPSTTNARRDVSTRVAAQIRARVRSKISRVTIRAIMRKRYIGVCMFSYHLNVFGFQIFNMVIVSLHFLSLIMLGIDVINLARYNNTKRKAKMNEMISAKMN